MQLCHLLKKKKKNKNLCAFSAGHRVSAGRDCLHKDIPTSIILGPVLLRYQTLLVSKVTTCGEITVTKCDISKTNQKTPDTTHPVSGQNLSCGSRTTKKEQPSSSPAQFLIASTHCKETAGHVIKDTVHKIYQASCHLVTHTVLLPPRPCHHVMAPARP